jgi:hypothetical protein
MIKYSNYELIKRGFFHENYCEDYLFSTSLSDEITILAVMDGCSMGTESYFASTLIGKLLKKISKETGYLLYLNQLSNDVNSLSKHILKQLFNQLKNIQSQLFLDKYELLSTLVLSIMDIKKREAKAIVIGDGVLVCNGIVYDFDQNNQPDYLGYHLQKDFENWFETIEQQFFLENILDISISTDGIYTFKPFNHFAENNHSENYFIERLLIDNPIDFEKGAIQRQLLEIEEEKHLKASDDLAIIRLILN